MPSGNVIVSGGRADNCVRQDGVRAHADTRLYADTPQAAVLKLRHSMGGLTTAIVG